jgi:DNA-binding CsgD family transcriptional regulator
MVGPQPLSSGPLPSFRRGPSTRPLTERQIDALQRASVGQTHKQIARALYIDEKSVGKLMTEVFRKLGARNMPHAVLLACRAGILDGRPRSQRHGDHVGYTNHQKRGEEACAACKAGESAYQVERRAARKAAKASPT